MTKKPTVRQLERRVINAAMKHFSLWAKDAETVFYSKSALGVALKRFDKACAALAKARKK